MAVHHRRRAGKSQLIPPDEQLVADTIAPEEAAERILTQDKLAAAIAHLTEDQRQVILLKFVEGVDNETAAQTLGKTVGSVKSLQHRALGALRRILEKMETTLEPTEVSQPGETPESPNPSSTHQPPGLTKTPQPPGQTRRPEPAPTRKPK
ncbi:MAG: sigma-70 family RNA polymerase sigma factor [Chloroflexi bacterium]|nr:sigma-70 family RNA polymerase sigma factor [Chloroflexota bacterium]